MLSAVQAPYALATPVVECVEDALQGNQLELARNTVAEIFVTKVWPSDANFLLIRVDEPALVMRRCNDEKVLLRHFGGDLDDCIRISIGTPEENSELLRVLDTLKEDRDA
jgi:histidinol-phosphate aminotransferase